MLTAEVLRQFFGDRVGLVHGQMKGTDKDAAMEAFQRGETSILVATTVIEVGVDVPQATIMVIEHAERFGLAQLHQLRGRVGRGSDRSTCLLLYKSPLGEVSEARITIMRETEDGFRIAEEDLRLRGEGEVLGTRQSGTPGFRLASLDVHGALLPVARDDAHRWREPAAEGTALERARTETRGRLGAHRLGGGQSRGLAHRAQHARDHRENAHAEGQGHGEGIEAEAQVPLALAEAFRSGRLGVMD